MSDRWTRVGAKRSRRRTKEADAEQNQCCVIDGKEPRVLGRSSGPSRPLPLLWGCSPGGTGLGAPKLRLRLQLLLPQVH